MTPTLKRLVALGLACTTTLALAACGNDTNGDEATSTTSTATGTTDATQTAAAQFPITIPHALGTAEIKEKPQRVVTLGQGSTEIAISLGIIPVAIEEYAWGADESGYLPWIKEGVEAQGGELPKLLKGADSLSAEEILSHEPDLILAPWSGITKEQYAQLEKIAPTVAYEKEPWVITWEEQVKVVAKALGEGQRAPELIDDVKGYLDSQREDKYGEYTFSYIYNSGLENMGIFFPGEQRVAMVSSLGLTVDPVVEELRQYEIPGTDSAQLSKENLDKLNSSDLIFTFYSTPKNRAEMHADPVYSKIKAIAAGAEVAPTDQSLVTASSIINPLTVRWAVPRFKELIDQAITKVQK